MINVANEPRYRRLSIAASGKRVPEARVFPMMIGGVMFVIGLFWFGWTALGVFWLSPIIAIVFIGAGFTVLYQQCLNYLVDTYQICGQCNLCYYFASKLVGSLFPIIRTTYG
jgi:hypothetical protein